MTEPIIYKNKEIELVEHPQLGKVYMIKGQKLIHSTLEQAKKCIDWNRSANEEFLNLIK